MAPPAGRRECPAVPHREAQEARIRRERRGRLAALGTVREAARAAPGPERPDIRPLETRAGAEAPRGSPIREAGQSQAALQSGPLRAMAPVRQRGGSKVKT